MTRERKRGLGRGLDALFRDMNNEAAVTRPASAREVKSQQAPDTPPVKRTDEMLRAAAQASSTPQGLTRLVPIDKLHPGAFQPRQVFEPKALDELAESIRRHGVLQPILVRPRADGGFDIVAGERRWRAAQRAAVHEVPVIIRTLDNGAALEVALIENIQRHDLNPIEEASAYQRLIDEFGHTQEQLAGRVSKSRVAITNALRLLKLPENIQRWVQEGRLTAGHARALVGHPQAENLAQQAMNAGWSVRQTEQAAAASSGAGGVRPVGTKSLQRKDLDTLALEKDLTRILGLAVTISGGAKGHIQIAYKSLDQLDFVIKRLKNH